MDTISQKVLAFGFKLDLTVLREPLAFIRALDLVFSIFAFSTTGVFSGTSTLIIDCQRNVTLKVQANFSYPFRLMQKPFYVPDCNLNQTTTTPYYLIGDHSSAAQFYVCIGVLAFLYCIATLVFYLGYQHIYRGSGYGPTLDFLMTAVIAFLWLVSTSTWAKGLSSVRWATRPLNIASLLHVCQKYKCSAGALRQLGRLNASVTFGFLNFMLWSSNCWFTFKETPFHKSAIQPADVEGYHCGQVVKPQAFKRHCAKRHGPLTKMCGRSFTLAPQHQPRPSCLLQRSPFLTTGREIVDIKKPVLPPRLYYLFTNTGQPRPAWRKCRDLSGRFPEEEGDSTVEVQPSDPFKQSLLVSEESEDDEQEEATDPSGANWHPKPLGSHHVTPPAAGSRVRGGVRPLKSTAAIALLYISQLETKRSHQNAHHAMLSSSSTSSLIHEPGRQLNPGELPNRIGRTEVELMHDDLPRMTCHAVTGSKCQVS